MPVIHPLLAHDRPRPGEGGGLLLPLPSGALPALPDAIGHDGRRWLRKREFHLTCIRRSWMQALPARLLAEAMAWLQARWPYMDRQIGMHDELWQLRESEDGIERHAIAVACSAPLMAEIRSGFARIAGSPLPQAPPHITLYSDDGIGGIGLPDMATLERSCVARLSWAQVSTAMR